ncbi:hypothetical protein Tco_1043343 [Tanacetum coccineum]|uniref:Maturase K n=1 Tax=Tanacetum coccineum TaxID=301880 RepID=A0ABQ5GLR7_9ASTR
MDADGETLNQQTVHEHQEFAMLGIRNLFLEKGNQLNCSEKLDGSSHLTQHPLLYLFEKEPQLERLEYLENEEEQQLPLVIHFEKELHFLLPVDHVRSSLDLIKLFLKLFRREFLNLSHSPTSRVYSRTLVLHISVHILPELRWCRGPFPLFFSPLFSKFFSSSIDQLNPLALQSSSVNSTRNLCGRYGWICLKRANNYGPKRKHRSVLQQLRATTSILARSLSVVLWSSVISKLRDRSGPSKISILYREFSTLLLKSVRVLELLF